MSVPKLEGGNVYCKNGRWCGSVRNVLERYKNGKPKKVHISSCATKKEAIARVNELKRRIDAEFDAEMERRAEANPKTRGLERAPKDIGKAVRGTVYWHVDGKSDYQPYPARAVKKGKLRLGWERVEILSDAEAEADFPNLEGGRVFCQNGRWGGCVRNVLERAKNGNAKQVYISSCATKKEAIAKVTELKKRIDAEIDAELERRTKADPDTTDLDRAPKDIRDADKGTVYWHANGFSDWQPYRVVVSKAGNDLAWVRACLECNQVAQQPAPGAMKLKCIAHGGGFRCALNCQGEGKPQPFAAYTFSANAESVGANGDTFPRPEWAGKRVCLSCLKYFDPTNTSVKVSLRKEYLVLAGVAEELHSRGYGDLVDLETGVFTNDCPGQLSKRRSDLNVDRIKRMVIQLENDENQHPEEIYTTSCERRKIAGHLVDNGAAAFTKQEGSLWDTGPDDKDLSEYEGTGGDTVAMKNLRAARVAACKRVVASAEAGSASKLHVLRFNCDDFVADDGTKVGGLFHYTDTRSDKSSFTLKPTKAFPMAIKSLANRLIEVIVLAEEDGEWVDTHKELEIEFFRYDGCDARGCDINHAVADFHAAKRVKGEAGAVLWTTSSRTASRARSGATRRA